MPEAEAETYHIHPFDLTKVWPHKDYPLIEVGVMELNRNPANYFNEVEQAAFSPVNIVPGMGYSPDKMLQARLISYPDAHRYRLGVNFETLPVNRPQCPVHTYNRDGFMRADENGGDSPNYEPNSSGGAVQDPRYRELPYKVSGDVNRYDHREGNDDYSQAGDLFRLMTPAEQKALIGNLAGHMKGIPERIARLQIEHFTKADPAYGRGVAEALGIAR
jgi:catalase